MGPRTVRLWRPRFSLNLRLVFISGRTGEMLDALSLGPVVGRALDARTSALALYFGLMDRLTPSVLAALGPSEQCQSCAAGRVGWCNAALRGRCK